MKNNSGLTYIFTGDGKGKTSAALGMVLRASCLDKKIAWIAWYKSNTWNISEKKITTLLPKVDFHLMGEGFYIKDSKVNTKNLRTGGKVVDTASPDQHKLAAHKALSMLGELLASDEYFLIVCDEICNAIHDGLLELDEVKNMLDKRGQTHLVLTGRNAKQELIGIADLVSEIKKVKHPYDTGKPAVKGLDF